MRRVHRLVLIAVLLCAGFARPALAGSSSATPDSAAAADTSAIVHPAAAPSAPSPPELEKLRRDIGGHAVRVWIGREQFEVHHLRLAPAGITFERVNAADGAATGFAFDGDGARAGLAAPAGSEPAVKSTVVGWDRIDHIDARRSSALVGFGVGVVGTIALVSHVQGRDPDPMIVLFYLAVIPPAILASTLIGACIPHWQRVWSHPSAHTEGWR